MRVYIELFLLDNAIMNGLTLWLAASLSGLKLRPVWGLCLSMLGAFYAALAFSGPEFFQVPAVKLLFALVLALALRVHTVKEYVRAYLCVLAAAAALGGVALMTALMGGGGFVDGVLVGGLPMRVALWCVMACLPMPRLFRSLRGAARQDGHRLALRVFYGGGWREYEALYDTGNELSEPLTGLPVVLLPDEAATGPAWPAPYIGAGGEGIMLCKRPERAQCRIMGRWQEIDVMVAKAPFKIQAGRAVLGAGALPPDWLKRELRRTERGGRNGYRRDRGKGTFVSIPDAGAQGQGDMVCPLGGNAAAAPQSGAGASVDYPPGEGR